MNVDRLRRLVQLLRDDAAKPDGVKFHLAAWAGPHSIFNGSDMKIDRDLKAHPDNKYFSELEPVEIPVSCDTFACALGLAAISGVFKAEGLSYTFMSNAIDGIIPAGNRGSILPAIEVQGRLITGFEAGAEFFDIESTDAKYFFDPECYGQVPTEAEGELLVAQRIEDFIGGEIDKNYHPDHCDEDDEDDED